MLNLIRKHIKTKLPPARIMMVKKSGHTTDDPVEEAFKIIIITAGNLKCSDKITKFADYQEKP